MLTWGRYPMPTVALVNGHAFAGGFMLAAMHDYRIMNPHKGYLCLNELDFGAPLRPPMASIFRQKLVRPDTYRAMVLESKRFNALEAVKEGFVDGLGLWDETLAFVQEMKLVDKATSGVYGKMKEEMWRETVGLLERGEVHELQEMRSRDEVRKLAAETGKQRVQEWELASRNGTAKL